jgi:hypothetical protein
VFDVDQGRMIEWVIDQDEWKDARRTLRSFIAQEIQTYTYKTN